MDDLLSWLQDGPLAEAIRGTALLYPLLGSLHIIGIALLIGPAVAFDLRLLGLGQQTLRVTTVGGYLLPLARLGFVIAAVTGVLMFLPGASVMAERGSAPWKLGLLLIAGLNVLIFHRKTYRSVSTWDLGEPTPVPARTAAVVSLTSWMGVTVAGSLLAYT
jgi:predicted membrane protein